MDIQFLTRPMLPATMAVLLLPSFLTGCGFKTGVEAGKSPADGLALMPATAPVPPPKAMPRPAPAIASVDAPAASKPPINPQIKPSRTPQYNVSDDMHYGDSGTKAQFASMDTRQGVGERAVARSAPMPRHVEKVTDREFEQKVIGSGDTVLVDFYADWCGPCKRLAPVLDELAHETPDARIVKVDIDRSPKVAARYGVRSIPTLILFKDGRPVTRRTGLSSKASLKELLAQ